MTLGICKIRDLPEVWQLHYPLSMMREEVHSGYQFNLPGRMGVRFEVIFRIRDYLFYRMIGLEEN